MSGRLSGVFPGGPSRGAPGSGCHAPIRTLSELARRERRASRARARASRTRRRLAGVAVFILAAAAAGFVAGRGLGRDVQPTLHQAAADALDRAVSSEVNRVLLELWRMEETERTGLRRAVP